MSMPSYSGCSVQSYGLGLCGVVGGGDVAVPQRSLEVMTASFSEFGATLRSWRDRLTPEGGGPAPSGRRRAPGLRRQEVAQLAGVSLAYLVPLGGGRVPRFPRAGPPPPAETGRLVPFQRTWGAPA